MAHVPERGRGGVQARALAPLRPYIAQTGAEPEARVGECVSCALPAGRPERAAVTPRQRVTRTPHLTVRYTCQLVRALRARIYQGDDEPLATSWRRKLSSHEAELSRAIPASKACDAMQTVLTNHAKLPEARIFVTVPLP